MNEKTGRSAAIRAWMAKQDGPKTSGEIADGIGEDRARVSFSLNVMTRDGILGKVGTTYHGKRYYIAREVMQPLGLDAEAMRVRYNQRRAQQRAEIRKGPEERARVEALQRAREVVARMKATEEANRQQRIADRKAAKAKQAQQLAAAAKAAKIAKPLAITDEAPTPKPRAVRAETYEEWQARTGRAAEVLPIGASAQPLRAIAFRDFTINQGMAA